MSWIWQRGGTPEELEARYGLRPLTWGDRLFWERLGGILCTGALWIALVLWWLSGLYEIGPVTVAVVTWIGLWGAAFAVIDESFERDLRCWPRRTGTD